MVLPAGDRICRWLLRFLLLLVAASGFAEGTPELNTNNVQSTLLYICNDFANHCSSGAGIRSQFATYDGSQSAGDTERLYFVTLNSSEVVYLGFQGSGVTSPSSPARRIVYRIKNLAGTIVQAEQNLPTSGAGYISTLTQAVNGPNALILTPPYNGYDALVFTPPAPGTYYIEFSVKRNDNNNFYIGDFELALFDITVGNTVTHLEKPGRLYSKSWQFYETSNFYGKTYILSNDSIITSAQFTGMTGGHWIQYCNQTGCGSNPATWIVNRKSLYEQQALYPQYKIFLNQPDPALFPPATTLGQLIAPMPYGVQNCATGHILFHVNVNKPGNVEITLTFPAPYQTRVLNQAVVTGDNLFDWDGLDGTSPTPLAVPNGTVIQFTVKYINGLTNLPLYDVESNSSGFTIALVSPSGSTPAVYWDDTNIPGGSNNSTPPGCTSPPGCHVWTNSLGDLNTMNTWWYNVSTTTAPATITVHRSPQALVFQQQPPQVFCANTSGHVFSVISDVNTDIYHWSYSPATGVTINQPTPASNTVTLSFGPTATSGTLSVYGSNTNCATSGPTSSLAITINPNPTPTIAGPLSACTGQTGNIYTTESGKSNYQWTVSSGGTITGGGTSSSNSVTVTWNTPGPQSVSVNYTNPVTLCTGAAPTIKTVTVNSRPVPTLTGPTSTCSGSSGLVYTTTPGKTNYIWTVSSGGTITAGGTSSSNTATVTWSAVGAQTISVSYTDPITLCPALTPTILNVSVNNLPAPTFLSGSPSACLGVVGYTYTTEPGMSNYVWALSGGTIVAGGTASDPFATITWNTPGARWISINYTYPFTTCTAPVSTTMTVMVQTLPIPSVLSGLNEVCQGATGNLYTTQPGMLNYQWSVTGGIITAGGGTANSSATVTWNNVGLQWISINYTDPSTGCSAAVPVSFPVTVKPLPVPTFVSGPGEACLNSAQNVYSTQSGMINYLWNITGGTITSEGGINDATASVTWNSAGIQFISVSYTNPLTQCTAAAPATFPVEVKALPVPTFTAGETSVCQGVSGQVYSTQSGMENYTWSVTGGTITAGGTGTSNTATVTWIDVGLQSISVGYTDPSTQCASAAATTFEVTVKPLPVPTITGPEAACLNTPGPLYFTEPGMSDYLWSAPLGTVTPGATPDIVQVTWNTLGSQTIMVSYTAQNGCQPAVPTLKTVEVNVLPAPTLSGATAICSGIPATYSTQAGMQSYTWVVPADATVLSGGTSADAEVEVSWNTPGTHQVQVNYALGTGCFGAAPALLEVTVNQSTPPVIQEDPPQLHCATFSNLYSTQTGMSGYTWTISPGGTITGLTNGNNIMVTWNTTGPQWVTVNFTNVFGCTAPDATRYDLTVNPLPVTTISAGALPGCEGTAHSYQVPADPECNFNWSIMPVGSGLIESGQGTDLLTVLWQTTGNATLSVIGTNMNTGCYASSSLPVIVHPTPQLSFEPCFDLVTTSGAKKYALRGASPYVSGQGVYSGTRVALNAATGEYEFDPNGASPGSYPVTYTYTNVFGCQASSTVATISVQNSLFNCGSALTDVRDGKTYPTASIGGRCWMAANLNYGTGLPMHLPSTDNCTPEKYCIPVDATCTIFGGLYQWDELMQYGHSEAGKGLCPPEWHIPTEIEWQQMISNLGTGTNPPDGLAGSFLKDPFLSNGFHALVGGLLYLNNAWSFTTGSLVGSMFWTSTSTLPGKAVARGMNTQNPSASKYNGNVANAFSVRCVHD